MRMAAIPGFGDSEAPRYDYAVVKSDSISYHTTAETRLEIGRKTFLLPNYTLFGVEMLGDDPGYQRAQSAGVSLTLDRWRRTSLGGQYSYVTDENTYSGPLTIYRTHNVAAVFGYHRTLRGQRQVSVSVRPGLAIAEVDTPSVGLYTENRATAGASVRVDMTRTWSWTAEYERGYHYLPGFGDPFFTDNVRTTIAGFVVRRVDVAVGGEYLERKRRVSRARRVRQHQRNGADTRRGQSAPGLLGAVSLLQLRVRPRRRAAAGLRAQLRPPGFPRRHGPVGAADAVTRDGRHVGERAVRSRGLVAANPCRNARRTGAGTSANEPCAAAVRGTGKRGAGTLSAGPPSRQPAWGAFSRAQRGRSSHGFSASPTSRSALRRGLRAARARSRAGNRSTPTKFSRPAEPGSRADVPAPIVARAPAPLGRELVWVDDEAVVFAGPDAVHPRSASLEKHLSRGSRSRRTGGPRTAPPAHSDCQPKRAAV